MLEMDENHGKFFTEQQIADRLSISRTTITNVLRAYTEQGLKAAIQYKRNPNSDNARRKVDGRIEAKIIQVACGPAPEGHARWSLRLLESTLKGMRVELDIPELSDTTIRRTLKKNDLQPHRSRYWCVPPKDDADFVAHMEDILDVYERPYNPTVPVVCLDEKPVVFHGDKREPIQMKPGNCKKIDDQYIRNGTGSIFAVVEPLGGRHHISVREQRTMKDWAEEIKYITDVMYPDAEKIILVMDNLNTHKIASLYKRFSPDEARRIAKRIEIHYTPVHGSWLNIAEIELSVLSRQCLDRRIDCIEKMRTETSAWEEERNLLASKVSWHFRTQDAREKLLSLYPKYGPIEEEEKSSAKKPTTKSKLWAAPRGADPT